jgi:putative ABC transport system permease protein
VKRVGNKQLCLKNNSKHPPKIFLKFFRWFCHPKLRDSIEGDLVELYDERVKEGGKRKADLKFVRDVLLLFRPSIIRPAEGYQQLNNYGMIKSYFKIGWRSLVKQKMYSAIKIGGFALGIAACMLITLFIKDELSYDAQYPNGNRIYRILTAYNYKGESGKDVFFQAPFANSLKEDYPEIEKIGRYNSSELFGAGSNQIKRADQTENTYEEGFVYVDQSLLEILDVPMIYGSLAHCLDEPNTLVITKSKADKYFPNENPVGKLMVINNDEKNAFKIGGVIADFPSTSHLQFKFFITLKGKEFWEGEQSSWGATNYPTYVLLKSGTNVAQFEKKLMKVVEKYLLPFWVKDGIADANILAKSLWFELQPVQDIHLRSEGISDGTTHGDIRFVWLFGAVAGFILLIACINFINLSTAKSANRAKEVGLRKTVGSMRSQVMNQFLAESFVFSFLSFVVGLILTGLLLPYFNVLSAKSLIFPWQDWRLYPFTMIAALAVGLLAGIYPAFYLSSFKPVDVLKGKISKGSKNSSTRSTLVVFQFTTSIVLIIATFIIYQQVEYILNKKVGFDKDQVLLIRGANTLDKQIKIFRNELLQLSQVKSASISDYLPIKGTKRNGNGFYKEGRNTVDKSVNGQMWVVDHEYLKTLGIKLVDGRNFSEDMLTDTASLIINQSMAKELGLVNPVGQRIMNWQVYNVIGVIEDFHFESLRDKIGPLALRLGISPNIVSVKIKGNDMKGTLAGIENVWKKFAPQQSIRFSFLDESFARMYDDVQRMGRIFVSAAILAIIVACLGLFALSAFMVEQRSKEISIRLVLGASMKSVFGLLTVNFLKLVLLSIVIAVPIAWYIMQKWLQDFTYRTEITWDIFALAGILAVLIAVLTISYQAIRAGLMNPVKSLKAE